MRKPRFTKFKELVKAHSQQMVNTESLLSPCCLHNTCKGSLSMPGTEQIFNIKPFLFFSRTAFCLITQLFLPVSEPVKAAKYCTTQFIALMPSGICPKVIHSATPLPGTESESRDCRFHILGCLSIHICQWSVSGV